MFRQRDCAVFPCPVVQESDLDKLPSLKPAQLQPQFQASFDLVRKKLLSEGGGKTVHGKPVNGRMLATLLSSYVRMLNESEKINIDAAWETTVDAEINRTYEAASKLYKDKTGKLATVSELPMEQETMVHSLYVCPFSMQSVEYSR
jgi:hypothetical protein